MLKLHKPVLEEKSNKTNNILTQTQSNQKIKPNRLKKQFINLEIQTLNGLKTVYEQIFMCTKVMINQINGNSSNKSNEQKKTRKNSFSLNNFSTFNQQSLNKQKQKSQYINLLNQQNLRSKLLIQQNLRSKLLAQQNIRSKLTQLKEKLNKSNQILTYQIQNLQYKIKKSIQQQGDNISIYNKTQTIYEQKLVQIQSMVQKSQQNVQKIQNKRKNLQNKGKDLSLDYLKFHYLSRLNKNQKSIVSKNIQVKNSVVQQIAKINLLYQKLFIKCEFVQNQNQNQFQQTKNISLINSSNQILEVLTKIDKRISQKQQQNSQQNPHTLIFIRNINKQIVFRSLKKTKLSILELSQKNLFLQQKIKQNQAFKALILLKNQLNNNSQQINKKKIIKKSHRKPKYQYFQDQLLYDRQRNYLQPRDTKNDQQILLLMLENQFLSKKLQYLKQSSYSSLRIKRNIIASQFPSYQKLPINMNRKTKSSITLKTIERKVKQQKQKRYLQITRNSPTKKVQQSIQTNHKSSIQRIQVQSQLQ